MTAERCFAINPEGPVNPTLITAADYETDVRPHIAALEAEVERLTEQLAGAVAENEKLRLRVAALENDGMELAARLGEAEEQIARLTVEGGSSR
jgi:chromosome segregation ATPase